jgi:hypothetical protein
MPLHVLQVLRADEQERRLDGWGNDNAAELKRGVSRLCRSVLLSWL